MPKFFYFAYRLYQDYKIDVGNQQQKILELELNLFYPKQSRVKGGVLIFGGEWFNNFKGYISNCLVGNIRYFCNWLLKAKDSCKKNIKIPEFRDHVIVGSVEKKVTNL